MKKNTLLFITLLGALVSLTGCEKKEKEKPRETFKTYEYYKDPANKAEMIARAKECEKMNYIPSDAVARDCSNANSVYGHYVMFEK